MTETEPLAFVVDDERAMLDIVTFALETQGFRCRAFTNAERAWTALQREQRPDLLVLDVMLPGESGLTLCKRVRAQGNLPVMMLTARKETDDRVEGLEAGADDYVTKPFHPRELALRARALVRRTRLREAEEIVRGDLVLQPLTSTVLVRRTPVTLSPNEYRVLLALMTHPDETLDFSQMLAFAWGENERIGARELVKTAVYRLRLKLDAASPGGGDCIRSVRGVGYILATDPDPAATVTEP
jgi:DNA-binding response OmpR family regulator